MDKLKKLKTDKTINLTQVVEVVNKLIKIQNSNNSEEKKCPAITYFSMWASSEEERKMLDDLAVKHLKKICSCHPKGEGKNVKSKLLSGKPIYSSWWCPNGEVGHFVCENATKEDIDEHLIECKFSEQTWVEEFKDKFISDWIVDDGCDNYLWDTEAPSPKEMMDYIRTNFAPNDKLLGEIANCKYDNIVTEFREGNNFGLDNLKRCLGL